MNYTLDDLRELAITAELDQLRRDHHQVKELSDKIMERMDRLTKLRGMILHFTLRDAHLSPSTMIGAFLKSVSEMMAADALGEDDE